MMLTEEVGGSSLGAAQKGVASKKYGGGGAAGMRMSVEWRCAQWTLWKVGGGVRVRAATRAEGLNVREVSRVGRGGERANARRRGDECLRVGGRGGRPGVGGGWGGRCGQRGKGRAGGL